MPFRDCLVLAVLVAMTPGAASAASVHLQTDLLEAKYCTGDEEGGTLHLRVRLRFVNAGEDPIILYRSSTVGQVLVGTNLANGSLQNVELRFSSTWVTDGNPIVISETWPNRAFAVLGAGRTFGTETVVPVMIKRRPDTRLPGLGEGNHLLQLRVSVWPEGSELAGRLREKWRSHGYLWTDPTLSVPMQFSVSKNPIFGECGAEGTR